MSEVVTAVLAAGKGERLGGPKALLLWPSSTPGRRETGSASSPGALPLAIAHAERRLAAESARVLVVTRRPIVNELLVFVRPGIDLVSSTMADDLGPAGSLAVAAGRLGAATEVVVTPVDTPPASAATVAKLLERLRRGGVLAVRPRYNGRAGHPVVLAASALASYAGATAPLPLREHLRALGDKVADEDVDDPSVLLDLDTPADVARATGALPRFYGVDSKP